MKKIVLGLLMIFVLGCTKDEVVVAPLAPTELIITNILSSQVNLSWTDNSTSETGFKIQRKGTTGSYATVGTVGADVTVYEDKGLAINTAYSYRVLSYNDGGDSVTYSNEVTASTDGVSVINTSQVLDIRAKSATVGGSVFGDGGSAITERGVVWSTSPNPTIALTTKVIDVNVLNNYSFSSTITGLNFSTKYYVRAYAINEAGTAYGNELSFTTLDEVAKLSTDTPSAITTTSATSGGTITSDGGVTITARGVVWSTATNPTIALSTKTNEGTGIGSFNSVMTGLNPTTTYYVKAYATNSAGTAYGSELSFTTATPVILTTTIGAQVWKTTNLDEATYRDGTPIPQVTDPAQWAKLTTGAWCYYENNLANGDIYGKLYNWYAVAGIHDTDPNTPNKQLAPTGYHIPQEAEWSTLTNYLGGESVAGGKMKATGTSLWQNPNQDATNSSGFTGLPGGRQGSDGGFLSIGSIGYWWSSSDLTTSAWNCYLNYNSGSSIRGILFKTNGFSVRCLRD
jgi:uncharacterized protein (TIGR02145 family)